MATDKKMKRNTSLLIQVNRCDSSVIEAKEEGRKYEM